MMEMDILGPGKAMRVTLKNTVSIAGLMIAAEAMIAEIPEPERASAMPPKMEGKMKSRHI